MSVNGAMAGACARIARQLFHVNGRIIGILPVWADTGEAAADLAPLLEHLAEALTRFTQGDVAFIAAWETWHRDDAAGGAAPLRIREVRPHLLEVVPRSCTDARSAGVALGDTTRNLTPDILRVLVDLGGYAGPGAVPPEVELVDVIVPVVTARKDKLEQAAAFVAELPEGKTLGSILIG